MDWAFVSPDFHSINAQNVENKMFQTMKNKLQHIYIYMVAIVTIRSIATLKMVFPPRQKVNSSTIHNILKRTELIAKRNYIPTIVATTMLCKCITYAVKMDILIIKSNEMLDFKFQERAQQVTNSTVPMSSHITINFALF